ncbi:MAG: 30S ribosomal protein S6 [Acidobacteria bacterium]|nr:30S ribosomal protein S6 [Acidobacteriota bacterium]
MSARRQYELVYIVSPEATDEQVSDLHAQIEALITRFDAELVKTENWGRRKLAYPIQRHKEGTYVLEVINGTGDLIKEIDRRLRVSEQVVRHLVVRVDQELKAAERARSRRKTPVGVARPAAVQAGAGEDEGVGEEVEG